MEALVSTDILKTDKVDKVVEVTGKLFSNIWKGIKIAYQTSKSGIKNVFNLFMDDILDPKTGEKTGKKTISTMIDTFIKSEAMQTLFSSLDLVGNAISARIDALSSMTAVELENMQKTHETELNNLDEYWEKKKSYAEGDAELTALYDRRQAEAKKTLLAKQKAEEDEYRKKQQKYAIAQALINGALAVTNIIANVKNYALWAFLIPFTIATTALQIKAIKAQTFARGGLVGGRDNGIDTVPARLTVGEYVVNKRIVDASGGAQGIERKLNNDSDYVSNKYKQGQIVLNIGTFVGNKLWVNSLIDEIRKELPRRI